MSNSEKELEEKLVEVGNRLLTPPSDVDELLPLLDKAETFLSRVEQSPSESMSIALHPAMKGLVARELLGHADADVNVAVTSCISEITRITAPEAPYDDDLMKDVFHMIVKAFEKLDDISSRSYSKRASILETVAKVRSCVVMLDLECDALILEMFHNFLQTIRDNHPENVFSSMEVIMTLVLEESEDTSPDLLSLLLTSLRKDNVDILPVARRLAAKVISNCAFKLKPCLMELVQSLGAPLSDYSKIVATVCQENSDVLEHNGLNVSGECLADDSKFSERTVSDELAQGSGKMESEVSCPEVGTASGRSPKSVMSNGTLQTGNDGCLLEPTLPNKKTERSRRTMLSKNVSVGKAEADKSDLIDAKKTTLSDHSNKKKRHKSDPAIRSTKVNDHSQIVANKGDIDLSTRKKGCSKEADSSQSGCSASKETEAIMQEEHKKGLEPQTASQKFDKERNSVVSPSSEKLLDTIRPRRGRPPGAKVSKKRAGAIGDMPTSLSGLEKAKAVENTDTDRALGFKKQIESTSDSDTKPIRHSGIQRTSRNVDDAVNPSLNSHGKMEIDVTSDEERMLHRKRRKSHVEISEGDTSGGRQASKTKRQKSKDSSHNDMVSSPKTASKSEKGQKVMEESPKLKSGKRRAREEVSKMPGHVLEYGENLVGARIKVWWPKDKQFYPGVIDSYFATSKKHKVLYFDGDEEVLLLKNERFEFIVDDEEEAENDNLTPESASEMSQKRKKKSDSPLKKLKESASLKSGSSAGKVDVDRMESEGKHGEESMKSSKGRRGGNSRIGGKADGSTVGGTKSREKTYGRSSVGTPKTGITSENEPTISTDGAPETAAKSNGTSKRGRKHKDATPMTGSESKGDASGAVSKGRSGSKLRSDAGEPGSKSEEDDATRNVRKPRSTGNLGSGSKSDGNKSGFRKKTRT